MNAQYVDFVVINLRENSIGLQRVNYMLAFSINILGPGSYVYSVTKSLKKIVAPKQAAFLCMIH